MTAWDRNLEVSCAHVTNTTKLYLQQLFSIILRSVSTSLRERKQHLHLATNKMKSRSLGSNNDIALQVITYKSRI